MALNIGVPYMTYEELYGLASSKISARDSKIQTLQQSKQSKQSLLGSYSRTEVTPAEYPNSFTDTQGDWHSGITRDGSGYIPQSEASNDTSGWTSMPGTTSSSRGRLGNIADALQYGVGSKLAGTADAIVEAGTSLGENIYKGMTGVSSEKAHEHFKNTMEKNKFTKDMFDSKGGFTGLNTYRTAKEYGYDPTLTQGAMEDWGKAYESGSVVEMAKSIARNIDKAPEFIAESAGELLTAPMRSAGIVLNTFDYANKTLERRKEITGKETSALGEQAVAGLTGLGQAVINKFGVDEMIGRTNVVGNVVGRIADMAPEKLTKSVVLNAAGKLGKALTIGAGKGLYEGTEEVMQQFLDIVGAKVGTDKVNEIFSDTTGKELFQAFGGGFAAGAGMRAPMMVKEATSASMDLTNTGLNKLAETTTGTTVKDIR